MPLQSGNKSTPGIYLSLVCVCELGGCSGWQTLGAEENAKLEEAFVQNLNRVPLVLDGESVEPCNGMLSRVGDRATDAGVGTQNGGDRCGSGPFDTSTASQC